MTHRLSKQFINVTDVVYLRKVKKKYTIQKFKSKLENLSETTEQCFSWYINKTFPKVK